MGSLGLEPSWVLLLLRSEAEVGGGERERERKSAWGSEAWRNGWTDGQFFGESHGYQAGGVKYFSAAPLLVEASLGLWDISAEKPFFPYLCFLSS